MPSTPDTSLTTEDVQAQIARLRLQVEALVKEAGPVVGDAVSRAEDAVTKAIWRAHKTIKNLCWFQVVETRGNIKKGKVEHWQVTIKVGFAVNDAG